MKTLPVLCFSSVIEETPYIRDPMKLIFAIPIKFNGTNVAREEKRKKEKNWRNPDHGTRSGVFFFFSFFIL